MDQVQAPLPRTPAGARFPATPSAQCAGVERPQVDNVAESSVQSEADDLTTTIESTRPASGNSVLVALLRQTASSSQLAAASTRPSTAVAVESWSLASTPVGNAIRLSTLFGTLRDAGDVNEVKASELRIVRRLGEGAFAVVEEAQYTPEGGTAPQRVAVKMLKPEVLGHEADLTSFIAEVNLLRRLHNKHIVQYVGVGSADLLDSLKLNDDDGSGSGPASLYRRVLGIPCTMFLVQEFMGLGTLRKLVARQMTDPQRPLYSYYDAFRWAIQVAEGMDYLHTSSPVVIHRDLKLENILLKGDGVAHSEAKIADFGLVALLEKKQRGLHKLPGAAAGPPGRPKQPPTLRLFDMWPYLRIGANSQLDDAYSSAVRGALQGDSAVPAALGAAAATQLSGRTGSYMYMAPEMYREEAYDEKVDVFSFGVMLYEVLTRYLMVCAICQDGSEAEVEQYAERVSLGYRPPLPRQWPEALCQLINECWHQDSAQRPSMGVVRAHLERMVQDGLPDALRLLGSVECAPSCIVG